MSTKELIRVNETNNLASECTSDPMPSVNAMLKVLDKQLPAVFTTRSELKTTILVVIVVVVQ